MSEPTATNPKRPARAEKEPLATVPPVPPANFPYEQYLEDRDGAPYLPLKWRLAWLRADQPQARLTTKLVSHQDGVAVFRAHLQLSNGASATGWGARSRAENHAEAHDGDDSLDYIVYAENQALARALAALGYGTQYARDFDPPADHPPILLPDAHPDEDDDQEDEPGILVPSHVEADQVLASTTDDENEADDDDSEGEPPRPFPLPPVRGEIRNIAEKRSTFDPRRPAEPTPPAPRPLVRPTEPSAESPVATPANPTPVAGSVVGNLTVDERIRNVRDESLRLLIKQIYHEARQRFELDEEATDKRSINRYSKPTYELDTEEAEAYLEVIVTAPSRRRR